MRKNGKYTIAICKGAALLGETRTLLNHWIPGEPIDSFAKRVQEQGILGNATAYRTRDIVRRVFYPRFLKPTDEPARILKAILDSGLRFSAFCELLLVFAARKDPLVYDFVVREFWPSVRRGKLYLDVDSVLSFMSEAVFDGRIQDPWSEQVSRKVSRGILGFIRDVGFLREMHRGRREVIDYRMSDEGILILARELHEAGFHNSALCAHDNWRLFGLSEQDLLSRMELLGHDYGLLIQRAGSVVEINWGVSSVQTLIERMSGQRDVPLSSGIQGAGG
ncbi:MAG: BrxA family protein [Desulfomonilaceae bacterium]